MENHQDQNHPSRISASDMHRQLASISPSHTLQGRQSGHLLQGHFFSRELAAGLNVHCVDATELVDTRSSGDFRPGLSVNVLLSGKLQFSLGSESYACSADNGAQVLVLKSPQPELFTRHLIAGQSVIKVNVSASHDWLSARFDSQWVDQLLQRNVLSWQASTAITHSAQQLLALSYQTDCLMPVAMEAAAINTLHAVLQNLAKGTMLRPAFVSVGRERSLIRELDAQLGADIELGDIAKTLGMSISTLQRKFKAQYGMTVMEYARVRRLEQARRALVLEGKSIQQVADAAGYEHTTNFISAFRKQFKLTPAELVRKHLGGPAIDTVTNR